MRTKIIGLLFLILKCFYAEAQIDYDTHDAFLLSLLNLEYAEANGIAQSFEEKQLKRNAIRLSDVLYYAGQYKKYHFPDVEDVQSVNEAYLSLAKGYQNIYFDSNTALSFELFNKAYNYAQENKYRQLEKFALISILEVFNAQVEQTNEQYLEYLDKLKEIKVDKIDEYYYMMHRLNYALKNVFLKLTINDSFFDDFDMVMSKFEEGHPFWANFYSSKAVFYEANKKYVMAEYLQKKALSVAGVEPYLRFVRFRSFIRLSEIYKNKNEFAKAIQYIDSSKKHIDLADTIRAKYYLHYYYSDNYNALGKYDKAYENLREAVNLKTLLDYENNAQQISRLNVKYQTVAREKQILAEQQKLKEQTQKTKAHRNWLMVSLTLLLLGTGIAILLQKNVTKKRKIAEQAALLEQQKVETLLKNQELLSIDAMIAGQEKERQRVANELHDDLGSKMATIKLHFENLQVNKDDNAFTYVSKLLDEAYQKIRGISHAKNSGVITKQGLLPALQRMARIISDTNKLVLEVHDFGLENRMENSLELSIFRIVQELVTNIIKHSEATKANIQLIQHEDSLNILVEDNGKGFQLSEISTNDSSMGLRTIEKRIEHLEGSFTIDSVLGKGASIIIDIPVA